ncbi:hypothetical protein [Dyadobacter sp. CY312]|uniref:hypothetical protein n=1 Tax=Dyadobacter sp. CY312 TaxID=2907303 RepID=UPI001F178424|nr:hypothetical protein [Dyadobacter sp. CY312]MCE7038990.1 hypothetical protein [Dyadobacter sp. CY312]
MIRIDTSDLDRLEKGLSQYRTVLPKSVAASAFRNAIRPMLQKVKSEAPIGKRSAPNGWGKRTGREYARGGYTRRDARIKIIPAKTSAGEVARGFVGISSKKNRVGWRTHFITTGFTDRGGKKHGANQFLKRSFDATIEIARNSFGREMAGSFQKWTKRNLPQGRY